MRRNAGASAITRRTFVAALGGAVSGLALGAVLPRPVLARGRLRSDAQDPWLWLHIDAAGAVAIVCHRSEMGQGVRSTLPAVVAAELGADPARVHVVQADGDARYGDQNTDGSKSVRDCWHPLRLAGATARTLLAAAAAERLGVPVEELAVRDHAVHHAASGRSLPFADLVAAAAELPLPDAGEVALRPDAGLGAAGRDLPLIDAFAYVTGAARYGADVRLPGMLTAVLLRPPVVGGKVKRLETAAALAVPGVRHVLELPAFAAPAGFQPLGGVAVLAEHTWAALRGRAALQVAWEHGANGAHDSLSYRRELEHAVAEPGEVQREVGDVDEALAGAARVVAADYYVPHLAHVPMEPPAAVAWAGANGCEVWAPTQHPQAAAKEVARALGVDVEDVTVHVTFLGGGFGRKSKPDYVAEAAWLSRAAAAPVRVQWTRQDDVQHGYYHACALQRLEAGLDSGGAVVAWRHRIASPPIASTFAPGADRLQASDLQQGILDLPLAVPHVRVESCRAPAHVRIGWMRSVYNVNHCFAVQSFLCELAHAIGRDPRDLLLEVLGPPRHLSPEEAGVDEIPNYGKPLDEFPVDVGRLRRVIERVTASADWTEARQRGRALGLAAHRSFLSSVAVVVSVAAGDRGQPRVDEAWISADVGRVVNRDRVRAQLEGSVVFGMSSALFGAITLSSGAVEQSNFRDYRVCRIGDAPRAIHVDLVESDAAPAGVGEPGVPPVAPALANALFALTGRRTRELPLLGRQSL